MTRGGVDKQAEVVEVWLSWLSWLRKVDTVVELATSAKYTSVSARNTLYLQGQGRGRELLTANALDDGQQQVTLSS